jgi:primosomal protein N'
MDSTDDIKKIAIANVVSPTTEYFYRYVCRWFSKTFHTPLQDVYEAPFDQVLLAYFEESYESMSEEDLELEVQRALNPDFDEEEEEAVEDFIAMLENEIASKDSSQHKNTSPVHKAQSIQHKEPSIAHKEQEPPKSVTKVFEDDTPDDEYGDL